MSAGGGDDMTAGDLATGDDMTMICTPGAKSCTGATLSTCNLDGTAIDTSTCVLGCNTAGNDCDALQPTAPAVASDFSYGGLSEPVIAATQTLLIFDTDTGEIRDGSGAVVRMPNAAPQTRFVEDGIGFHRVSGVGIWTFSKLTVPATTLIVFKSPFAASILSAGDLTIAGMIDVRGYLDPTAALATMSTVCASAVAGPGGTVGGMGTTAATGAGAGGIATDTTTGAGGGGYGDTGGAGGKNGGTNGGTAGAVVGSAAINPLAGGFGGGPSGGNGGGGGGALQLAAEGTLTISGGINAGGCGGLAGDATHGGGGGGSGGAILVEAPTVHLTATAKLAANGGGGGGGGDAVAGQGLPGVLGSAQAMGGSAGTGGNGAAGGQGGALNSTGGQSGSNGSVGGGAGGGSVGRVRLNSRTGATIDGGSLVSPAATAGTVVIQ